MARKQFDDATGEHVTKPDTAPVSEIYELLAPAFEVECPRCEAKPGQPCTVIVGKQGERRYPHRARLELGRERARV